MKPPNLYGVILLIIPGFLFLSGPAQGTIYMATFSMSGVKGTVKFTQSTASNPTSIILDLKGVNETLNWRIHTLPVMYQGNASQTCSSSAVGAVFDPDNSASGSCSQLQRQHCAIGDLTGKFGSITQGNLSSTLSDSKLPLTGLNNVFQRALVLSTTAGTPKACALITSMQPAATALATFKGPVAGSVYFRQATEGSNTLLYANLFFVDSSTALKTLNWKIQTNLVGENYTQARCTKAGAVFNPYSVSDTSSCSTTNHGNCKVGDLTAKVSSVNVTAATTGRSSTQAALTDLNLPIIGSKTVVSHSLVLYDMANSTVPVACADILKVQSRKAKALFESSANEGVSGTFVFSQASPFDPTMVNISIMNLRSMAEGYHVHQYPNPPYKGMTGTLACSSAVVGQHLNPYGITLSLSPPSGTGTNDQYEIGDLAGKYGSFLNQTNRDSDYTDYNLPLFGQNSLIGRSVVIHKLKKDGNKRWVCRNILLDMDNVFKMETDSSFTDPQVIGHILMTQYKSTESSVSPLDTAIYLDLETKDNSLTTNHNWHVHEKHVGDDMDKPVSGGRCGSVGPHYNPYKVYVEGNYKATCSPTNPLRCELGDLSRKHRMYDMGSGPRFYTDVDASMFGDNNVVGRGVVVHIHGGTLPRLGCTDIVPVASTFVEKTLEFVEATPFSKMNFISRMATVLTIPKWRITYIRKMKAKVSKCANIKFGIIGKADQASSKFDDLKKNSRQSLAPYSPSDDCIPSGAGTFSVEANLLSLFVVLPYLISSSY